MPSKQEEAIKELKRAYVITFGSKEGETVLRDLENRTGVHTTTFDENSHKTAFLEGQRNVTLYIKSRITMQIVKEK